MKNVLAFFMLTSAVIGAGVLLKPTQYAAIEGTVQANGKSIWVAQVDLLDSTHQWLRSTLSGESGHFEFDSLFPANYIVRVVHPAYLAKELELNVGDSKPEKLVVELQPREKSEPLVLEENEKTSKTLKRAPRPRGETMVVESEFEMLSDEVPPPIEEAEIPTGPGTLTAGEINDFSKWVLWEDLTETKFNSFQKQWGFYLKNRYAVQVTYENGNPVVDAPVKLVSDKNEVVFIARTDNTGKAELWADMIPDIRNKMARRYKAFVHFQGQDIPFPKLDAFPTGINTLKIKGPCDVSDVLDIAFVVDATGSMGDEINYLKTELKDVIQRVQEQNEKLQLRTASVFYRDNGDQYVTRESDFSSTTETTLQFIQTQYAAGGGDFPEAVDEALDAALNRLSWSQNARGRILFLVLDAPPHQADSVVKRMHQLVYKAAAMGVRIVPITGSGINKDVEFLMRSMALATNSTYVFLTDHSGVGNKHLAPSTDDYDVQKLNDLMVNLISRYAKTVDCQQDFETPQADSTFTEIHVPNDSLGNQFDLLKLKCYPVPSTGPITFEVSHAGGEIFVMDANGKLVLRFEMKEQKQLHTDLSQLASGYYFIRYQLKGKWVRQKIVLVHS